MYKIGFDLMGGDYAPTGPMEAALKYAKENQENQLFLYGLADCFENLELPSNITPVIVTQVIENNDEPALAIRRKKDSSIVVGSKALKNNEIDAFISSGSTGALVAAGVFIAKRIPGIERPALPGFFPSPNKSTPTIFLDIGANIETKPNHLVDYSKLASLYAKLIYGIDNPKVALLNIGTEEKKGTQLYQETYQLLKEEATVNFVGNMEPRDILTTSNDIVVMDGFTGNMVLKTVEGNLSFFSKTLKDIFKSSPISIVAALLVKGKLSNFKKDFDYTKVGGTPIFGIEKLIIKAHGSSDSAALYNAIKKSEIMIEKDFAKAAKGQNGLS